jgi:hypothetical protein
VAGWAPRWVSVAAGVLVGVATLVGAATPAAAKTTVSVKGDVVTITVPIDCAGCKGKKGPDGSDLAKYWKKTAEKAWNDAFAKYPYCSKYKFELKVDVKTKPDDFKGTDGRHRVQVGAPGSHNFPPSGYTHKSGGKDSTDAYTGDFDGTWAIDIPPPGIPHEIGHTLGLTDDYTKDANGVAIPNPGREQTLMADGGPVDKALVERVGNQLAKLGKLKCEVWHGTISAQHVVASGACTFTWSGTFDVEVGKDRNVSGSALLLPSACGLPGTVTITGTTTNRGFTLGSDSYVLANGTNVPKTGDDRATGTSEYHDAYNDVSTTVELKCSNCKEAVG